MAAYSVRLVAGARRQLQATPDQLAKRIRRAIRELQDEPRPLGAKLLSINRPQRIWRIRVGDYRILYEIRDEELVVLVIRVGHRGVVYRGISSG